MNIIELILRIQNFEFEINIQLHEQPDIEDITTYCQASGGNFWLALDENQMLIGTIGIQAFNNNIAILKKFFVNSEYRGHKIGKALYEELLRFAIKMDFRHTIKSDSINHVQLA
jgi:GNAT superfamily N-acetyltransferase